MVTIPTTLALEETKRLLEQLEEQDIRCGLVRATEFGGLKRLRWWRIASWTSIRCGLGFAEELNGR